MVLQLALQYKWAVLDPPFAVFFTLHDKNVIPKVAKNRPTEPTLIVVAKGGYRIKERGGGAGLYY